MRDASRYRLDDLRRLAAALATGGGMVPARAVALASQLLWFDAAGAPQYGLETLPSWLERMTTGEVDPRAEGFVVQETVGTAVFDGGRGVPSLILARAGELAIEKARDAGTGLVRVANLGPAGPAAAVAADMAVGPVAALILGPGPAWSLALPADEGLPVILDSTLAGEAVARPARKSARTGKIAVEPWLPWTWALVPEGDWLVAAIGIKAIEPLSAFQVRIGARIKATENGQEPFAPRAAEESRREAREHGVAVTETLRTRLNDWAARLGIAPLVPASPSPPSAPAPSGAP